MMAGHKTSRQIISRWLGSGVAGLLHACAWAKRMPSYTHPATRRSDCHLILEQFVSAGSVCLDIGAHGGNWSYPMAKRVGGTGCVYAFEAFPYYAKALRRALWLRRIRNVKVHAVGLADVDGEREIVLVDSCGDGLTGMIHLTGADERPHEQIAVPIRKLDTVMSQDPSLSRVSFVKIDVEGAELAVLRGATQLLQLARPVIYCEIVDNYCRRYGHQRSDVLDHLKDMGYRPFALQDDGGLRPIDRSTRNAPDDLLFVPTHRSGTAGGRGPGEVMEATPHGEGLVNAGQHVDSPPGMEKPGC